MVVKNGTKKIIPLQMIKLSISQSFEELQGWNWELKLITPISITGSHFGTMAAILDFFNNRRILEFKVQEGPEGPWGSEGPLSPPQELEGGARSAPNF